MTKMEYLNSFFINRLMAVAEEIFEAVKDTVSEYQEEIERTKQENRRLMSILATINANVSNEKRIPDVQASNADGVPSEQQNFNQHPMGSDPSLIQLKLQLATMKQEADTELNEVPANVSPCAKSVHGEDLNCFSVKPAVEKKEDDGLQTHKMVKIKLECCDSQLTCPDTSAAVHNAGPSGDPVGNVEYGPCFCPHCEETFDDLTCLTTHLQNHADGLFDCKVCGKPFTDCKCLTKHKKVLHKQGRLYRCKLCGKSFRYPKSLTVHLRTHTGEKPYCCRFCGKGFSQKGHCNEHERIHTGEKPYTCPMCGKGFVQSTPLKSHIRNHHHDQLQLLEGQKTEKAQIKALVKKGHPFS